LDDFLPRLPYLEHFIEEGAVMHNRFAQFLGVRRPLLIAHSGTTPALYWIETLY
jgi:hypothetical protein